jgi:hypothetical protein
MYPKEGLRKRGLKTEAVAKTSGEGRLVDPSTESAFVSKTMTIRGDQYVDLISLSAYNRLTRRKPDTVSGIVRDAITRYLSEADDTYRSFGSWDVG